MHNTTAMFINENLLPKFSAYASLDRFDSFWGFDLISCAILSTTEEINFGLLYQATQTTVPPKQVSSSPTHIGLAQQKELSTKLKEQ